MTRNRFRAWRKQNPYSCDTFHLAFFRFKRLLVWQRKICARILPVVKGSHSRNDHEAFSLWFDELTWNVQNVAGIFFAETPSSLWRCCQTFWGLPALVFCSHYKTPWHDTTCSLTVQNSVFGLKRTCTTRQDWTKRGQILFYCSSHAKYMAGKFLKAISKPINTMKGCQL